MVHAGDEDDRAPARRSFSVRLPAGLSDQLEALSSETGTSMNKLIGTAVAAMVERPDLAPTGGDISPQIARDAVRQGPRAIGALKGIAKHADNRSQVTLACVLWAAAARLIRDVDGPQQASAELTHTAHVAETANQLELAVTLWEEALALDRNNLDAVNRLGQRLHHLAQQHNDIARYREAERLLARVTFVDNHAKLFHGWSALHVARADQDTDLEDRAAAEIDEALKSWAFGQRDGHERNRWLRQVERLAGIRPADARSLIHFANRNARWGTIDAPGKDGPQSATARAN